MVGKELELYLFTKISRRKGENYRPISILPVITKLFEKEIFGQLYQYLINNSLLSRFQSGFRPKHSTLSLLIQIRDNWLEKMDKGELTGFYSHLILGKPLTLLITKSY